MKYIDFDESRELDLIPIGRVAIDFNPTDYYNTLDKCENYKKYVGGSPANIAVGLARLGKKVGFIGKVSDDQFGTYVEDFFAGEGIDISHVTRTKGGEKLHSPRLSRSTKAASSCTVTELQTLCSTRTMLTRTT